MARTIFLYFYHWKLKKIYRKRRENLLHTWISSVVCTMNMSTRSSRAPSSQLLNGAALLANSANNRNGK